MLKKAITNGPSILLDQKLNSFFISKLFTFKTILQQASSRTNNGKEIIHANNYNYNDYIYIYNLQMRNDICTTIL